MQMIMHGTTLLLSLLAACSVSGLLAPMRSTRGAAVQRGTLRMDARKDARDAAFADQQEILARRRNKLKMEEYNKRVLEGRAKADEKVKQWEWQTRKDGKDPLIEWQKMKASGKLAELYREEDKQQGGIPIPSASFGVGGEFGTGGFWDTGGRFDLRLPYVDQGYVDESADVMNKWFGGGKKKKAGTPPPAAAETSSNKRASSSSSQPRASTRASAAAKKPSSATKTPPAQPAADAPKKKGWFW